MRVTARDLATARRPRRRRENEIQRAILEALRAMPGVVAWKTGGGLLPVNGRRVRMGHRGVSDLIGWRVVRPITAVDGRYQQAEALLDARGVHDGRRGVAQFLAIEVKAKGKVPTPEQRAFLDAVQAAGGIAVVAYEVQDVIEALR